MKTILTLAFVLANILLANTVVLAADLKVPQLAPKREPVVVAPLPPLPETAEACKARIATYCSGTHKGRVSKHFNNACIRRNLWQCKGK